MADEPETVPGMADYVERRRRQLELTPGDFAERAGLTRQGLDPVRSGIRKDYADKTRFGVARALAWPTDWYERLLDGEDPADWLTTDSHMPAHASDTDHLDLTGVPEHVRRQVHALVDEHRRRQES